MSSVKLTIEGSDFNIVSDINIDISRQFSESKYESQYSTESQSSESVKSRAVKCTPDAPVVYRNNLEVEMALNYLSSVGIKEDVIKGCKKILNAKEGEVITNVEILEKLKKEGKRHPKLNGIISASYKYLKSSLK